MKYLQNCFHAGKYIYKHKKIGVDKNIFTVAGNTVTQKSSAG